MDICVVGVGYVGLVTGAVFADLGNDVICVDSDVEKINSLNHGVMPIYEPGLKELVNKNREYGRLVFTTDLGKGVKESEIIFIAVGTPPKENGETDLSFVASVAGGIAEHIDKYKIIVNKSTVPVGTGNFVREIIEKNILPEIKYNSTVQIYGYTDRIGSEEYNRKLSDKRAVAVKDILSSKAKSAKYEVYGVGENNILFDNDSPIGRQLSRTVQVYVITPKEK